MCFSPCSCTHHVSHIKSFINSCPLFSAMGQCQGWPHLLLTLLRKLLENPCWGCWGNKCLLTIAVCIILVYLVLLESRWTLLLAEASLLLSPRPKNKEKRKNKFWKRYLPEVSEFKKICTYYGLGGDWVLKLVYLVSNWNARLSFWAGRWFGRRFWVRRTYQSCCSATAMVADAVHQAGSRRAEMSLGWHYPLYLCLEEGGSRGSDGARRERRGCGGIASPGVRAASGRLMATEGSWEPTPASS